MELSAHAPAARHGFDVQLCMFDCSARVAVPAVELIAVRVSHALEVVPVLARSLELREPDDISEHLLMRARGVTQHGAGGGGS